MFMAMPPSASDMRDRRFVIKLLLSILLLQDCEEPVTAPRCDSSIQSFVFEVDIVDAFNIVSSSLKNLVRKRSLL